MAEHMYFNNKYHIVKPGVNPNSLFASFNVFKSLGSTNIIAFAHRTPYPILISNPSFKQVLGNLNKSDLLVYASIFASAFGLSIFATRPFGYLVQKLMILHFNMHLFNIIGIVTALNCSYYRLTGLMDNGLRWKRKDKSLNKYDFTRDFENHTIFKHFRERADD
jgi:hypothetical protein